MKKIGGHARTGYSFLEAHTVCHNYTKKRVGCDPHYKTSKTATLKWCPFNRTRDKRDEFHDVTEEEDASSNTPKRCAREVSRQATAT